jgi:hypothetical protein
MSRLVPIVPVEKDISYAARHPHGCSTPGPSRPGSAGPSRNPSVWTKAGTDYKDDKDAEDGPSSGTTPESGSEVFPEGRENQLGRVVGGKYRDNVDEKEKHGNYGPLLEVDIDVRVASQMFDNARPY